MRSYYISNKLIAEQLDTLLTSTAYGEKYLNLQRIQIPEQAPDHSIELFAGYLGLTDDEIETSDAVDRLYKTEEIRRVITTLQQEQLHNAKAYMHEVPVARITLDSAQKLRADAQDNEVIYTDAYSGYETDEETQRLYNYTISVYPSDTKTLQLLEELMGLKQTPLQAKNVKEIRIDVPTYEENEWNPETIEVTDSETIARLIENAYTDSQRWDAGKYVVWEDGIWDSSRTVSITVVMQTGSMEQIYYKKDEAPVKLIEQLIGKPLIVG